MLQRPRQDALAELGHLLAVAQHDRPPTETATMASSAGLLRIGQQHQREHHHQILDDQPADRDPAPFGLDHIARLQCAQQHDSRCDRQRQTEHDAARDRPAEPQPKHRPERRRHRNLRDRPRHRDLAHRHQVFQRKMQPNPEHEENNADLGQLEREPGVGDEPGGKRPDQHPGKQIARDRRNSEAMRQRPHQERDAKARDDSADQGGVMRHGLCLGGGSAGGQATRPNWLQVVASKLRTHLFAARRHTFAPFLQPQIG